MENKPEQAKETAPTKPSVDNKKVPAPPVVSTTENKNIKPIAHTIGVLKEIDPPHIVAIQEKILIPVGTAMIIVAAKK